MAAARGLERGRSACAGRLGGALLGASAGQGDRGGGRARAASTLRDAEEFAATAGHGVQARVAGRVVEVGRPGATVRVDGEVAGEIEIADTIRPEAAEAVARLQRWGSR